jgi:heme/copper-type cytochrome/quinol oxidase subunit 2
MSAALHEVALNPLAAAVALLVLGALVYFAWRHHRQGRDRRRFIREREEQRRAYWGWDG